MIATPNVGTLHSACGTCSTTASAPSTRVATVTIAADLGTDTPPRAAWFAIMKAPIHGRKVPTIHHTG